MAYADEQSLTSALQAGDATAFEQLVRSYSPRLLSSATRVLSDAEDARDAVQEALISAWKNIHQFTGGSSIYTWLHRIVINQCLGRLRSSPCKE